MTVLFSDGSFISQTPRLPVFTNLSGDYQISFYQFLNISPMVVLRVQKEGSQTGYFDSQTDIFLSNALQLDFGNDFTDRDFKLQPLAPGHEYSISGRVVNTKNQPIEGVMVSATDSVERRNTIAYSDREGRYRIEQLRKGNYYLHFSRSGYIPAWYEDALLWENGQSILLEDNVSSINYNMQTYKPMQGNSSLLCVVRDQDGLPLSGAMMAIVNQDSGSLKYTFSEKFGRTLLTELAA